MFCKKEYFTTHRDRFCWLEAQWKVHESYQPIRKLCMSYDNLIISWYTIFYYNILEIMLIMEHIEIY